MSSRKSCGAFMTVDACFFRSLVGIILLEPAASLLILSIALIACAPLLPVFPLVYPCTILCLMPPPPARGSSLRDFICARFCSFSFAILAKAAFNSLAPLFMSSCASCFSFLYTLYQFFGSRGSCGLDSQPGTSLLMRLSHISASLPMIWGELSSS